MLSNARGKHSSPGVYIEEIDMPYAAKSIGATTLGVAGETLKGPAFDPIRISDWNEFQDYFGGTSTEKYEGNNFPKYELPYIAKSYLQESKQLEVCRVLGFSGYNAGNYWTLFAKTAGNNPKYTPIAVLRSKAAYTNSESNDTTCTGDAEQDKLTFITTNITISSASTSEISLNNCGVTSVTTTDNSLFVRKDYLGIFKLTYTTTASTGDVIVSLDPSSTNYILNVLGNKPNEGSYPIFIEELYDNAYINLIESLGSGESRELIIIADTESGRLSYNNYKEMFRYASTPWFVSELKGNNVKKLFRFHTISDGDCANYQIKISISNILPDEGLFDVLIRDFNDSDKAPVVLERFTKCNLIPGTSNYLGLKVGTTDGEYINKSKYVTVEINSNTEDCVPCGFLGYPMRRYFTGNTEVNYNIVYNKDFTEGTKVNRHYFGLSDLTGIDVDIFKYKGKNAYSEVSGLAKGFHLDSFVSNNEIASNLTVDGVTGFTFQSVSVSATSENQLNKAPRISTEENMKGCIYEDKRMRKFTCCPYGGFDGWDIYRDQRTNTDNFRANKYKGATGDNYAFTNNFDAAGDYGLTGKVINSDYYAYLAAYKQFENPEKIKVNLFATPGIDYVNNTGLVNEVLNIIEESRQGDCLYIVTTPDTDDGYNIEPDEAVANLEGAEINSSYAATYYPWVKYYDSTNKKYINLPVTKDVVRNFAYTDNVSQPWFASAGMSRGNVDCVKANIFTKVEDEDILYEGMINPVKSFSSDGVKIWGNKTMYLEDTPLNRINVRRLMIKIKDLVMRAAKQLIFEQNDNTIDKQFRSIIDPILADAKNKRGISDYKIKTDTSAEARDRKELPAKIWVKPINCLEYIPISFVITPEGSNFEE